VDASEPPLSIDQLLDAIGAHQAAPAGGSTASLVGAMAAALCTKVARFAEDGGAVAQAEALRRRLAALAPEDASAFTSALDELREVKDDYELGRALGRAADVPLRIASACSDVAELAATLGRRGTAEFEPDARVAAVLAAAAARAASLLVEANLGAAPGDERVAQARALADGAAAAAGA
jgi:formiminotetrahydrofolate cyclodeaminase